MKLGRPVHRIRGVFERQRQLSMVYIASDARQLGAEVAIQVDEGGATHGRGIGEGVALAIRRAVGLRVLQQRRRNAHEDQRQHPSRLPALAGTEAPTEGRRRTNGLAATLLLSLVVPVVRTSVWLEFARRPKGGAMKQKGLQLPCGEVGVLYYNAAAIVRLSPPACAAVAVSSTGRFGKFATAVHALQDSMIAQAKAADPAAKWTVDSHSRGKACIVEDGDVWEKGCIMTLIEDGELSAVRASTISGRTGTSIEAGAKYSACALSFVLHARSPAVTLRGDARFRRGRRRVVRRRSGPHTLVRRGRRLRPTSTRRPATLCAGMHARDSRRG